ncbi:uncharacterized protein [Alexandromys fortis]|uniref:uncharacterized protein n=1 Tax=Alexandromys fortis TaxID=100897 RepID=UPI00215384F3|nr:uncharacterized protein LOC126508630 [Microtus fortis]
MRESWQAKSAPTQAQSQDYTVAHLSTHLIYELLEHGKGLDLQIHSSRIPRAQGNNSTSKIGDNVSTQEPADNQNPVSLSLAGAPSILKFFSEEFIGQHFQEVGLEEGNPQPGDLFLFEFQFPVPVPFVAHVGVYCGQGEIIHFEGRGSTDSIRQKLQGYLEGVVYKQGLLAMKHSRKLLRVLRKRGGVDPKVLERRVREAMNSIPPPYHLVENNCVHFALKLLGMNLAGLKPQFLDPDQTYLLNTTNLLPRCWPNPSFFFLQ